jgi:hypothetical protein
LIQLIFPKTNYSRSWGTICNDRIHIRHMTKRRLF